MDFPELGSSPAEEEKDMDEVYQKMYERLLIALISEFDDEEIIQLRKWGLIK